MKFLLYGWPTTYLISDFARRARFFDIHMLEDPKNAMGQTFSHILATEERTMYSIQGGPLSADSLVILNYFGLRQDGSIVCISRELYRSAQSRPCLMPSFSQRYGCDDGCGDLSARQDRCIRAAWAQLNIL